MPIRVLHINYSDIIGARFNGYCMMEENTNPNFEFSMAVWKKKSDNKNVFLLPPQNKYLKYLIEKTIHLTCKFGFDHFFSFCSIALLSRQKYFQEADIINLHIIHGDTNFSIKDLPKLCRLKKIVWTIHDQWAISGGCIHPFDCKGTNNGCPSFCPYPRYNSLFKHRMPYYLFRLKDYYYKQSKFNIVVSTDWMKEKIKNSLLLGSHDISVIPFGVNLQIFQNRGKCAARIKIGIPKNNFVVILRNTGLSTDTMKGLKYTKLALEKLQSSKAITIIVLEQSDGFIDLSSKYQVITPGWLDQNAIIDYYSASDVLLMPSIQESFGLMAIEAMACEVPVIVAEGSALPEVVGNDIGGIVVKPRNYNAIINALSLLIENQDYIEKLSKNARRRVMQLFDSQKYIKKYQSLYSTIMS
jgi:glycosyltransferase involved in cell wall biosynthesis